MKKNRIYLSLLLIVLSLVFMPSTVFAAAAEIKVSSNTKTLVVGNETKVTVTVKSNQLFGWEYCISYDSSVLKLTSSTADANTCVKTGAIKDKGQTSSSETFTFKALKSGSSNVTVKSYAVYNSEIEQIGTSINSIKITTMTQKELEATYSTNANLKSLSVGSYELTPAFDKSKTEYKVEVENDVTSVKISAAKEDSTAEVSGTGDKELTEGNNKFEIIVTAQKGNSKTYTVNVYRKELDPIKVMIDNKEYFIIRKKDDLPQYPTFTSTTIDYEGDEVPALHSDITDYTLLALKDDDSNISMFIYRSGNFIRYEEIKGNNLIIYPQQLPKNDLYKDYKVVDFEYNKFKMQGYALNEDSNFLIIYAQNIETGEDHYYSYDKLNNTIQLVNEELMDELNEKLNLYKYIIMGLVGFIVLLLLILIFRKPKRKVVYELKDDVTNEELSLESERQKIEEEIKMELDSINEVPENKKKKKKDKKKKKNKNKEVVEPIEVEIPEEPAKLEEKVEEEVEDDVPTEIEETKEIVIEKNTEDNELKEFINSEINENYKSMNFVDENLSKREKKKLQKKLRKEEKARLKEF